MIIITRQINRHKNDDPLHLLWQFIVALYTNYTLQAAYLSVQKYDKI